MRPSRIPYTRKLLWTSSLICFFIYIPCMRNRRFLELVCREFGEVRRR